MRKRYLGIYSHGKFNFMDEKEALCTEHRAYCDVCVKNNVLMVNMTVWESPFCHPEFISGSIQGGSLQFNAYKMLKQVQHDDGGCKTGLPRKSDDFLAMTNNRNLFRKMHNDQNGLVLMFGSSKQHMAQETKPDFDRNMIEREVA